MNYEQLKFTSESLEEWRDCLVAYYAQVLQRNEPDLEASVRQLLLRVGVAEERVDALRAQNLA